MRQIDTLKSEVRPWGSFTIIKENASFKIKKIELEIRYKCIEQPYDVHYESILISLC